MRRVNARAVLLLMLVNAAFAFPEFNTFFTGTKFGPIPGPCTNADPCTGIIPEDLPNEVLDIEYTLYNGAPKTALRNLLKGTSEYEMRNLACDRIVLRDMDLAASDAQNATMNKIGDNANLPGQVIAIRTTINGLTMVCTANLLLKTELILQQRIKVGIFPAVTITGRVKGKTEPEFSVTDRGLDVTMNTYMESPNYSTTFPNFAYQHSCTSTVPADSGFAMNPQYSEPNPWRVNIDGIPDWMENWFEWVNTAITNVVQSIFSSVIRRSVCQFLQQAYVTNDGGQGLLNKELDEMEQELQGWLNSTPDDTAQVEEEVLASPENYGAVLNQDPSKLDNVINVATDEYFEMFSVGVNRWLGVPDESGSLVINQVMTDLSGDNEFYFSLKDKGYEVGFRDVPYSIATVSAFLTTIGAKNINKFRTFQLFENGYGTAAPEERNQFTTNHKVELSELEVTMGFDVTMTGGTWATVHNNVLNFAIEVTMRFTELELNASVLNLLDLLPLYDRQIGQLVAANTPVFGDKIFDMMSCSANGLYFARILDLGGSFDKVDNILVTDTTAISNNLRGLAMGSIDAGAKLLQGFFKTNLASVLVGPIRDDLNRIAWEDIFQPGADPDCKPYEPLPDLDEPVNLHSDPAKVVLAFVNDVLGGEDLNEESSADLNAFLHTMINYYIDTPVVQDVYNITSPTQGTYVFHTDFMRLEGNETTGTGNALIRLHTLKLENVDTLYKWTLAFPTNTSMATEVGLGKTLLQDPLSVSLGVEIFIEDLQIRESFDVRNSFETFELFLDFTTVLINQNDVFSLKLVQAMSSLPCWMSVMDAITLNKPTSKISVQEFQFQMTNRVSEYGTPPHPLKAAVDLLEEDFKTFPTDMYKTMWNNFMQGSLNQLADAINKYDLSLKPIGEDDVCDERESPLDSTLFQAIFFAPKIPELVVELVQKPDPIPSVQEIEQRVVVPEGADVFDFSDSLLLSIVDTTVNSMEPATLREVFQVVANSSGNPLSDLLRLGDDGTVILEMDLDELGYSFQDEENIPGVHIKAGIFTLAGLENFDDNGFTFLTPVPGGVYTTRHKMSFASNEAKLVGLANFTVTLEPEFTGASETLQEEMVFEFNMTKLQLEVMTTMALNMEFIDTLTWGHFFDVGRFQDFTIANQWFDCLLSSVHEHGLYIPQFQVTPAENSLEGPRLTANGEVFSNGIREVTEAVSNIIISLYLDDIPSVTQRYIRRAMNKAIEDRKTEIIANPAMCSDPPRPQLYEGYETLFFTENEEIQMFQSYVDEYLRGEDGGFEVMNNIVREVFSGPANPYLTTPLEFHDFELAYNDKYYGSINMTFSNLILENVHGIRNFDFLLPTGLFSIRNRFELVSPNPSEKVKLTVNVKLVVSDLFQGEANTITDDLRITLKFDSFEFLLDTFAKLDIATTFDMPLGAINDLSKAACVIRGLDRLEFEDFLINFANATADVRCRSTCESPLLAPLNIGSGSTEDDESSVDLTPFVNGVVDVLEGLVTSDVLEDTIRRTLFRSNQTCENLLQNIQSSFTFVSPEKFDVAQIMGLCFLGVLGAIAVVLVTLVPLHFVRRRNQLNREMLKHALAAGPDGLQIRDDLDDEELALRVNVTKQTIRSLFLHPSVPLLAKVLVPVLCLLNIAGLIVAILFAKATAVDVYITFLGSTTQPLSLVPFTLISTINDFWNSGAWPLALLVGLASCAWPVLKNLFLFVVWFTPETVLKPPSRESFLHTLDILGKWSFVDVYVIVLMLAGLKLYVSLSFNAYFATIPDDFVSIEVNVTPQIGIVLLCIAAATSLLINHIVLFYHHRVSKANAKEREALDGLALKKSVFASRRTKLMHHRFAGTNTAGQRLRFGRVAQFTIITILMVSAVTMLAGSFLTILRFQFKGVIGLLLEQINAENLSIRDYSLASLGLIMGEARMESAGDYVTMFMFQFLYFITVLVAPFLYNLVVIFIWTFPLRRNDRKIAYTVAQIVGYWSALEVFMLGVVMMLFEIHSITTYILDFISNDSCTALKGYLKELLGDQDGVCFDVNASLESPGAYILLFGLTLQLIFGSVFMNVFKTAMNDIDFVCERERGVDFVPKPSGQVSKFLIWLMTKPTDDKIVNAALSPAAKASFYNSDYEDGNSQFSFAKTMSFSETQNLSYAAENPAFSGNDVASEAPTLISAESLVFGQEEAPPVVPPRGSFDV